MQTATSHSRGRIELDIDDVTPEETVRIQEILAILVSSGAVRLKNGKAIMHFDSNGVFQGVELEYWAFRRKSEGARLQR